MKSRMRIGPLTTIFIYNILFMAASGLLVPGIPLYLSANGFDGDFVNITLASIAVVSLLGQVTWGYLSDRAMTKLFFVELGTVGYAFGYLALALCGERFALLTTLVALNFVGSASYPAAMALLANLSSVQNRGRSMGVFWSAASLGWAISVAFTGFIVESLGGSYLFGLCSLLYAASSLAMYLGLRGAQQPRGDNKSDNERREPFLKSILGLGGPFMVFLFGTVIFFMADFAKNVYVPIFYAFELGLGMVTATLLLSLTSWIEIPVNIIFGSLSDRAGRKRVVIIGYALCGIYMLINAFAWGFEAAVLAMCLYGAVWGAFSGASSALASELVDESNRGFAMGLYNSSWNIASMIAPLSIGTLAQASGYRFMLEVMGALMFAACLLLAIGVRERSRGAR